jgi:hypothetical protein
MDSLKLCRVLREMLPVDVHVAAGPACAMLLTERERASLGAADGNRVREFESGRAYAKRALGMLGMHDVDLLIGPDRAPVWPAGAVGSITHVLDSRYGIYAAAAVARADSVLAVGIDFEIEDTLHPHVWRSVLTEQELKRIVAFSAETRRTEAQYIWCAKEVTAKVVGVPFDPAGLEVERDPITGDFVAKFIDNNRGYLPSGLFGRTALLEQLLMATAVLRELS